MTDLLTPAEIMARLRVAAAEALEAAIEVVEEAIEPHIPVLHGDLRDSVRTAVDPETLTAGIGYGAGDERLGIKAIVQHEGLHHKHPHGGEAKFATKGITESKERAAEAMAARLRQEFNG